MALDDSRAALVMALRHYGGVHAALMRGFADALAMNTTDAAALSEVLTAEDAGAPLSPAALAARIGRSRPATSAVLNRLEGAGLIRRGPHPTDRRASVLRADARVHQATAQHFLPLSNTVEARLAAFSHDQITTAIGVIDAMTEAIDSVTR